jgi:hypothetical protein
LENSEFNIWLFEDGCIIYWEIMDNSDIYKLQTHIKRSGEWAIENEMKINPEKCKVVSFTNVRVNKQIRCYFGDQLMAGTSSFKYL